MSLAITDSPEQDMGRVTVAAKIENLSDRIAVRSGADVSPRVIDVLDALVDTGCVGLGLPVDLIEKLGLSAIRSRRVNTTNGVRESTIYDAVRLTIQDRICTVDVWDLPEGCPVLIGQVPLELMDFVVDPMNRRLIGNPEHNGEWMHDMY